MLVVLQSQTRADAGWRCKGQTQVKMTISKGMQRGCGTKAGGHHIICTAAASGKVAATQAASQERDLRHGRQSNKVQLRRVEEASRQERHWRPSRQSNTGATQAAASGDYRARVELHQSTRRHALQGARGGGW